MHALLLTVFWIWVAGCVVNLFNLMEDHPRIKEVSIGADTASFILNIALLAWIAFILWGQ